MNIKLRRTARTSHSEEIAIFDADNRDEEGEAMHIGKIDVHYVEDQIVGTLLIVSIITIKISDTILDSRVGALDRTLGFLFGLGRGLVIVVVAFLFFAWLVPDRSQPEWVKNAKSRVVLQGTGQWLMSMLPDDPESTILKRLKRNKPEDQEQTDTPTGGRSSLGSPAGRFADAAAKP